MNTKQQIKISEDTAQLSRLERFNLDFEYNKTLREIKHEVKLRTQ